MLYISRRVKSVYYGVVDTDDDVETVASIEDICDAVRYVKIKGVMMNKKGEVYGIRVVGDDSNISTMQAKLRALYDVSVSIYKGEVVSVLVGARAPKVVTINVSSLAHKLSAEAQYYWSDEVDEQGVLHIVLDDSVEITGGEVTIGVAGVKFDITACGPGVADAFYTRLLNMGGLGRFVWSDHIIDTSERGIMYWSSWQLSSWMDEDDVEYMSQFIDIQYLSDKLYEKNKKDFEHMSRFILSKQTIEGLRDSVHYSDMMRSLYENGVFQRVVDSNDFKFLYKTYLRVLEAISNATGVDEDKVTRFYNFIKYFKYGDEVKQIYVDFCHVTAKALLA